MRSIALVFVLALGAASACDNNKDDADAPATTCDLNYKNGDSSKKDFGEGCTSNSDCAFGECLMPGKGGNINNSVFGFCTRGCDCNNDTSSQIANADDETLECLYPSGFRNFRHVVPQCTSLADCQALDPRWTDCRVPDQGTVQRICFAE